MTNKITKLYNNWVEYKIGWGDITSSNNTYNNIIYLSQNDYDALSTKDPNTLYSTPWDWGLFSPENIGTVWQVLTKTTTGYWWDDASWEVIVSNQSNNILSSGMKIWAGTQANYEALTSYDTNTLYLTI